jgi:hypothetical protein|tara:strand:+ start:248 stop:436 length:189 start_codon:yes stop_codon:yes gene_type:complete
MKIKARENKLHRVNANSIICDRASLDELKEGKVVDISDEAAEELLNMGMAEKASNNKKKESK